MAKYTVSLPIAGALVVDVEADNEAMAIEEALQRQEYDSLEWEIQSFFVPQFEHKKNHYGHWYGATAEKHKEDANAERAT